MLLEAEQQIRLLDRLVASNLGSERRRLLACLESGRIPAPRLQYTPCPDFSALERGLAEAAPVLADSGSLGVLYAERAEELGCEAALAAAAGRREFAPLAARRFPAPRAALARETDALVRAWLSEAEPAAPSELVRADDNAHPESLLNVLRRLIGALRLPIRVELRAELSAVAAAGDGFVALRPSAALSPREAQRVALHELVAHVVPRFRARAEAIGLFRTGARGANDEEEGRALVLEARAGFLEAGRRRELALRHVAALAARDGGSFADVVALLLRENVSLEAAVDLALRAARGGGLGREVVYLPAFLRLSAAFSEAPEREHYFERGRVTLAALETLRAYGSASSITTGA